MKTKKFRLKYSSMGTLLFIILYIFIVILNTIVPGIYDIYFPVIILMGITIMLFGLFTDIMNYVNPSNKKIKVKLALSRQELNRLWEWENFIPHDKYKTLDRILLIKIRKKLSLKND